MAKLYFRYGAMNSGKTTNLLQVAYNYEERDQFVVIIKADIDKKGGNKIVARVGMEREVDYLIKSEDDIIKILKPRFDNLNCILVDEAQFLTEEQVFELFVIAKKYDIPVIAYGLRTDFKTNAFPGSLALFRLADEFEEAPTICRCGEKARFNARIINGKFVSDGNQVAIDEMDEVHYESLCGKCYLEKVMNYDMEEKNNYENLTDTELNSIVDEINKIIKKRKG